MKLKIKILFVALLALVVFTFYYYKKQQDTGINEVRFFVLESQKWGGGTELKYILMLSAKDAYQAKDFIIDYISKYPFNPNIDVFNSEVTEQNLVFLLYVQGMPLNNYVSNEYNLEKYIVFTASYTKKDCSFSLINNGKKLASCIIPFEEFKFGNRKRLIQERLKYVD